MISSTRLRRLETNQDEIRRQLDTIVTALIASEPRTGVAAEAFDGLRRNIVFAAQERRRLLIQLVTFSDAIERGATVETLRELCQQWCAEAGVGRHDDPASQPDWFTVVEGEGPLLEVVEPAWVDTANHVLLQPGTARRRPEPAEAEQAHPERGSEAESSGLSAEAVQEPVAAPAEPSQETR